MTQLLLENVLQRFPTQIKRAFMAADNIVTIEVPPEHLIEVAQALYEEENFDFKMLLDVCGVDYLDYGTSEWRTRETTFTGFSRGVDRAPQMEQLIPRREEPRYATVYHLLSLKHNHRLRIRVFLSGDEPKVPSVFFIWNSANWYEREAFDLFGIVFDGHPDLRRILTDYGFVGHPFRKDFPLIGDVELRYDAEQERCVYEPVSIQPRVTVPKVIRDDNRYLDDEVPTDKKESK